MGMIFITVSIDYDEEGQVLGWVVRTSEVFRAGTRQDGSSVVKSHWQTLDSHQGAFYRDTDNRV